MHFGSEFIIILIYVVLWRPRKGDATNRSTAQLRKPFSVQGSVVGCTSSVGRGKVIFLKKTLLQQRNEYSRIF